MTFSSLPTQSNNFQTMNYHAYLLTVIFFINFISLSLQVSSQDESVSPVHQTSPSRAASTSSTDSPNPKRLKLDTPSQSNSVRSPSASPKRLQGHALGEATEKVNVKKPDPSKVPSAVGKEFQSVEHEKHESSPKESGLTKVKKTSSEIKSPKNLSAKELADRTKLRARAKLHREFVRSMKSKNQIGRAHV